MEDKLRQESNQTLSDDIIDIGQEAVAVGTGAAFLYRAIGAKKLSHFMDNFGQKVSTVVREIDHRPYDRYNIDEIGKMRNTIRNEFKRIDRASNNSELGISILNDRSTLEAISQGLKFRLTPGNISAADDFNEMVIQNVRNQVRNAIREHDGWTNRDMQNADSFVKTLSAHVHAKKGGVTEDSFDIARTLRKFKNASSSPAIYGELQNAKESMKEAKQELLKNRSDSRNSTPEKFLEQVLLNADALTKAKGDSYKKKTIDTLLHDRQATIGDILNGRHKISIGSKKVAYTDADGNKKQFDVLDELSRYLKSEYEDKGKHGELAKFKSLTVDPYLRIDEKGSLYSFDSFAGMKDRLLGFAAGTLPGKILKLRDIQYRSKTNSVLHFTKGSISPTIAAIEGAEDGKTINHNYWTVLGETYRQNGDSFEKVAELDGASMYSGRYGTGVRLLKAIAGLNGERKRDKGGLRYFFDINGNTKGTMFEDIKGFFTKFTSDEYMPNIIEAISSGKGDYIDRFENAKQLHDFLNNNVFQLNTQAIETLNEIDSSKTGREILSLLQEKSPEKLIERLVARSASSDGKPYAFHNENLNLLIEDYFKDQWSTTRRVALKTDQSGSYYSGQAVGQEFDDILRTELSKEYWIRKTRDENSTDPFTVVKHIIESAGLSEGTTAHTKRLAYSSLLEDASQIFSGKSTGGASSKNIIQGIGYYENILSGKELTEGERDARRSIINAVSDQHGSFDTISRNTDSDRLPDQLTEFVHIKKGIGPLDIVKSINESIKNNSADAFKGTITDFIKQWYAGRSNMENVTEYTLFPYFFAHRLGAELNDVGIGFSNASTGSVGSLAKTIALKRLLPIAVGATYLEWADDTFGAVTGTKGSALFMNGVANLDLAGRRVMDATGLSSFVDSQMDFAPMQYWGGSDGFYDHDREKDYYANGYDAVRKARYWSFGSANEFRGGQIQYFSPNLVRRLNSDYYNKSLYDGYWDKWSHSLLPTPTNPLSPLLYAMDPYWLEKKHKDDRPYAVSGPMFEEGTPWGIILNPTIGELIKPAVRMNEDRMYGGTDVKAIIYNINKQIHQKALDNNKENVTILDNGQLSPSVYRAYDQPTIGERIIKFGAKNNVDYNAANRTGFGVAPSGINMQEYVDGISNASGAGGNFWNTGGTTLDDAIISKKNTGGLFDRISDFISTQVARGNILAIGWRNAEKQVVGTSTDNNNAQQQRDSREDAIKVISNVNNKIMQKAKFNKSDGVLIGDKLSYSHSAVSNAVFDEADIQELIQTGTGGDLVSQTAASFRVLAGIYGYGANRFAGFGEESEKHIADSSDMTSFSRNFWDESIGGFGGETAEIGRRFIPEFRRSGETSPLMNTMPDWMPDRFRLGDPYTVVPLGEARMPGKGYESLNKLHPDQYGIYGSFDRYKILGDIAPFSQEFKEWRKIAQTTVKDPKLKDEMQKIQDRINEMSKAHDFYDYHFLGNSANYEDTTVTKVLENGEFTVHGSKETYKLAGVDFNKNDKNSQEELLQYIHPGMKVTIATDANTYHAHNFDADTSLNAAVFVDGDSVSQNLLDDKVVKRRKGKLNAADTEAMHNGLGKFEGTILEFLSHTDLPLVNDRWLRIRDPYESYQAEQVYGTPYQTWSEIMGTIVAPAWNRAVSNHWNVIKSVAMFDIAMHYQGKVGAGKLTKMGLSGAASLLDRGAFIGGTIAYTLKPDDGEFFKKGQKVGSALTILGNMYTSAQSNLFDAAVSFGQAGYMFGDFLDKGKLLKNSKNSVLENLWRNKESAKFRGIYALGGMAAGVLANGAFGHGILSNESNWKPEAVKKKWELEEYFDRLTYIKYMGLYEKAAQKAASEEGIEVKKVVEQLDEANSQAIQIKEDLQELIARAQSHNMGDEEENKQIISYQGKLDQMRSSQLILKGGAYTRSAMLYKQAAEATMYGLKDNAAWIDIVKALPKYERDYFIEFMKERDPKEQEKILKTVSPFMRRALKQMWKMDYSQERGSDNDEYFQNHNLPNLFWDGWKPDSDLNKIKAKTIKNEGMMFSDFGIYESQYRDEEVINADNLSPTGSQDSLTLQANLQATLNGLGLIGTEVSVEPKTTSGIQSVINITKVIHYNIGKMVDDAFGL